MTTEVTCALNHGNADPQDPKSAIDRLVLQGYAREAAEDLVRATPMPDEGASVADENHKARRAILDEHHKQGIPPADPPPLQAGSIKSADPED